MDEVTLFRTRSPYQKIELTRIPDGEVALYLDDAIQFVSGDDDILYHHVLAGIPAKMMHGRPAAAIIFGGGDGLAARDLLANHNIKHVRMIELDPAMLEFSSQHPVMKKLNQGAFQDPRMEARAGDARKYINGDPQGKFDIAILDFPDPLDSVLEKLFVQSLYERLMKHLNRGGEVISVQASAANSPTEKQVQKSLLTATQTMPTTVRFRGSWMDDGAIVYAGLGMDPSMAKLPKSLKAPFVGAGTTGGSIF